MAMDIFTCQSTLCFLYKITNFCSIDIVKLLLTKPRHPKYYDIKIRNVQNNDVNYLPSTRMFMYSKLIWPIKTCNHYTYMIPWNHLFTPKILKQAVHCSCYILLDHLLLLLYVKYIYFRVKTQNLLSFIYINIKLDIF